MRYFLIAGAVAGAVASAQPARADALGGQYYPGYSLYLASQDFFADFWEIASTAYTYDGLKAALGGLSSVLVVASNSSWYTYVTFAESGLVSASGHSVLLSRGGSSIDPNSGAAALGVPGPIAAAGVPAALGLMGFAAWRRRQQTSA